MSRSLVAHAFRVFASASSPSRTCFFHPRRLLAKSNQNIVLVRRQNQHPRCARYRIHFAKR